jgi:hypothetical protein
MSIMTCNACDTQVDTDFEEMRVTKDEWRCESCHEADRPAEGIEFRIEHYVGKNADKCYVVAHQKDRPDDRFLLRNGKLREWGEPDPDQLGRFENEAEAQKCIDGWKVLHNSDGTLITTTPKFAKIANQLFHGRRQKLNHEVICNAFAKVDSGSAPQSYFMGRVTYVCERNQIHVENIGERRELAKFIFDNYEGGMGRVTPKTHKPNGEPLPQRKPRLHKVNIEEETTGRKRGWYVACCLTKSTLSDHYLGADGKLHLFPGGTTFWPTKEEATAFYNKWKTTMHDDPIIDNILLTIVNDHESYKDIVHKMQRYRAGTHRLMTVHGAIHHAALRNAGSSTFKGADYSKHREEIRRCIFEYYSEEAFGKFKPHPEYSSPKPFGRVSPNTIVIDDLQPEEKDTTMIEIKSITYINGTAVEDLTDDQIFGKIAQAEDEIAKLKTIKAKSEKIKAKIAEIQASITGLVEIVDAR